LLVKGLKEAAVVVGGVAKLFLMELRGG